VAITEVPDGSISVPNSQGCLELALEEDSELSYESLVRMIHDLNVSKGILDGQCLSLQKEAY
jgi:hypothetical protein